MNIEPVTGALGAEVHDIDLSSDLSNSTTEAVYQAFLEHKVLFFRDQHLDPAGQLRVSRLFGEPERYPFIEGLPDFPEVIDIVKSETDAANFGGSWHSDTSYMEHPAKATMLYGVDVPTAGGDTMFANTTAAYEALSMAMQDMVGALVGVFDSDHGYGGSRAVAMGNLDGMKRTYVEEATSFRNEHPIVRTHPETGLKGLYIGRGHTAQFKDWTVEESKPLIDFLAAHISRPEFTCRFRWTPGAIAVWDNRATQHYAVNDYSGTRRHMRRITFKGDRPF
jgi:taurine dioxygenase